MKKNFIFDFGWVLVQFDSWYMTQKYITDPTDCELAQGVIFDRLYWDKIDAGTITDDEVKEAICSRLPERLWNGACKAYDNWYYNIPFIDEMVDLVKDIKAVGGKVFILSNISIRFSENYKHIPALKDFFSLFDGLVFSGPLHITKPNAQIFNYLLNKYGLTAEETLFIDDLEKNVNGAKDVGISGYVFDGNAKKLRNFIFGE